MSIKVGSGSPTTIGLPPLDGGRHRIEGKHVPGHGQRKPVEPHPLSVIARMPIVKHVVKPPLQVANQMAHVVGRFAQGVQAFCKRHDKAPKDLSSVIESGCTPDKSGKTSWCADADSRKAIETMASDSQSLAVMKALWNAMNVQGHERRHGGDINMPLQQAINMAHHLGKLPLDRQPEWFRKIDQAISGPEAARELANSLPYLLQGCAGVLRADVAGHMPSTLQKLPPSLLQRTHAVP